LRVAVTILRVKATAGADESIRHVCLIQVLRLTLLSPLHDACYVGLYAFGVKEVEVYLLKG